MKLFSIFVRTLTTSNHTQNTTGRVAMDTIKNLINQKKYREASSLIDKTELAHPEYFKALIFYRGKANLGLAKQLNLIVDNERNEMAFSNMTKKSN